MKIKLTYRKEYMQGGFGAGNPGSPPGPPAAPTKDTAAKNLLEQGMKKPVLGFSSTILGDNAANTAKSTKSTILGGG